MFSSEPVAAARPGRDGLWPRRLLSLVVGGAVAVLAARVLLPLTASQLDAFRDLAWVAAVAHLGQQRWRPRRTGRLVWRARVFGRHGVEPGFVARRSAAGWVELIATVAVTTTLTVGVISLLPDGGSWAAARPVLLGVVAVRLGVCVYREVRFPDRVALTASGLRDGRHRYAWSDIAATSLQDGGGVRLRLAVRQIPPPVVGGRGLAVSDERLLAAIDQVRSGPQVLAVGLPISAAEPAG
ncbi:hypothetical protein [Micromonospora sp. HK10]|uniref:hypothetical protein n=1 Tax=Micromonospora sp. HK10 TaxID=1538294 RepID=UPI00062746DA|nr:hypothetical protein [Micromonospora sp. HK10]KKJ95514.1 hypothetical protein LQ51_26650 [Micromonospora sp. HK10]